jgi:ATP-binding cassette subfamily B protein
MAEEKKRPAGGPMGGPMGGGMAMQGEKAGDFKNTMLELYKYIEEYKTSVIMVIIFAVFSTVFNIVGPKLSGKVLTKLFDGLLGYLATGGELLTDFKYIRDMLLLLAGLYLISSLFGYLQGFIMSGVAMKVTYRFRKDISEKMNRMPLKYFDTRTHGEVLSRVTNDVDTISQTLNQSLNQLITQPVMVLGVLMLSINLLMTAVAVTVVPISMVIIMFIVKQSQKYFAAQQKSLGELNGHIEEMYGGHNIVQAFNGEKDSVEKFEEINGELYKSAWKSQFLSGLMMPVMMFVGNVGYVAICILGGYLAVKRVVEVGDIQSFIQYMRSFTQPIAQLANISNTLQSTAAAAERVFEFLAEKEEADEDGKLDVLENVKGVVEFKNINFGYNSDKIIINNFSAVIKPGQKIAIVGPTGAGKTTIVKLLMRFYEINGGQIFIDNTDIGTMRREAVRGLFGMVLQETWLYNASIMENIRYGSFGKPDEDVIKAAKAAHCDEFIRALPHGYGMELNEEASNISQGQKQLLTIARVFLADPKILILDEATSSVDTRTEILIQNAMDSLMKGRTSFVIAHRLSTIRDSDIILVMRDGDIVEQGDHNGLLSAGGFYAGLYNSQFSEGEE